MSQFFLAKKKTKKKLKKKKKGEKESNTNLLDAEGSKQAIKNRLDAALTLQKVACSKGITKAHATYAKGKAEAKKARKAGLLLHKKGSSPSDAKGVNGGTATRASKNVSKQQLVTAKKRKSKRKRTRKRKSATKTKVEKSTGGNSNRCVAPPPCARAFITAGRRVVRVVLQSSKENKTKTKSKKMKQQQQNDKKNEKKQQQWQQQKQQQQRQQQQQLKDDTSPSAPPSAPSRTSPCPPPHAQPSPRRTKLDKTMHRRKESKSRNNIAFVKFKDEGKGKIRKEFQLWKRQNLAIENIQLHQRKHKLFEEEKKKKKQNEKEKEKRKVRNAEQQLSKGTQEIAVS
jgi:hypothetical protein